MKGIARSAVILGNAIVLCFEFLVFARLSPLARLARPLCSNRLATLRPHFEADFYAMQFRSSVRRRLVERDPLLHYHLLGWREHKAPNRRFEPRYVREDLFPDLGRVDPLLHVLAVSAGRTLPRNEAEAAAPAMPRPVSLPLQARRRALIFHHARGGGSSKFLAIFEDRLRAGAIEPVRLRAVPGAGHLVIWPGDADRADEAYDLSKDAERFLLRVAGAAIDIIVVSHVIDFRFDVAALLHRCTAAARADLWIILHDYLAICPRVNLVDAWHRPCAPSPPERCRGCVAAGGGEIGSADPAAWRRDFAGLLARADRILSPSADASRRLGIATGHRVETWQPEPDRGYPAVRRPVLRSGERLKVAVLGSLNRAKGSGVLLDLARRQRQRAAPVAFTLFGASDLAGKLRRSGVPVSGRFADSDLLGLLLADLPHLVLLPAIWPETWSFVMTHALKLGLPVAAFAHGAQHERLVKLDRTDLILPLDWIGKPDLILDRLLRFRDEHLTGERAAGAGERAAGGTAIRGAAVAVPDALRR